MKKILFTLILCFTIICNAHAYSIENELTELKANMEIFRKEISEIKETRLDKTYPIGSIYETTEYSSVLEVQNALGGTWEVYASGKTLIGVDENDSNFNTVNKIGGVSSISLTTSNLPSHTHSIPALTGSAASAGAHQHSIPVLTGTAESAGSHTHALRYADDAGNLNVWGIVWKVSTTTSFGTTSATANSGAHTHNIKTNASTTGSNGAHTHNITTVANITGSSGSGTSFTNLSPYITVYMYKRIA